MLYFWRDGLEKIGGFNMELNLRNKIAIVTGGASGIGQTTAEYFADEGAKVIIVDRNQEGIDKTVGVLKGRGADTQGISCDVTDEKMVSYMVHQAIQHFETVDFLVNCAGIEGGMRNLEAYKKEDWLRIIDVNLIGTIQCCKAVMPILREKKAGRIINIASEAGVSGEKGLEIYSASKGGVISFTKALAKNLGRFNVTVNAVAPAFVHSPLTAYLTPEMKEKMVKMYTIRRLGEIGEIASMIVYLCSDRCSWITGQTISINGGFSMK
jgi:NAD(P)-dependent dehydrogenase (short-subunit alcohol dehydrogenase family)